MAGEVKNMDQICKEYWEKEWNYLSENGVDADLSPFLEEMETAVHESIKSAVESGVTSYICQWISMLCEACHKHGDDIEVYLKQLMSSGATEEIDDNSKRSLTYVLWRGLLQLYPSVGISREEIDGKKKAILAELPSLMLPELYPSVGTSGDGLALALSYSERTKKVSSEAILQEELEMRRSFTEDLVDFSDKNVSSLCEIYLKQIHRFWKRGISHKTFIESEIMDCCADLIKREISLQAERKILMKRSEFIRNLLHRELSFRDETMMERRYKLDISEDLLGYPNACKAPTHCSLLADDETKKLLGEIWSLVQTDYPEAVPKVREQLGVEQKLYSRPINQEKELVKKLITGGTIS